MLPETTTVDSFLYIQGFLLVVLGCIWYFWKEVEHHILQRIFAWNINREQLDLAELLRREKGQVFQLVHEYRKTINGELNILDVGSGPAVSLDFVPRESTLVCLDPNPHYKGYIDEKLKKDASMVPVTFVQGYAEAMPFESNTFNVVVCTLVLCTVKDIVKALAEIKRVLKPGGILVLLDHILVRDKSSWTYMLQIASSPKQWLFYGCHMTRNIEYHIKDAGFSNVQLRFVNNETAPLWLKSVMIGKATK